MDPPKKSVEINPRLLRRFQPLPTPDLTGVGDNVVSLGRQLFYEPRLSLNGDLSCQSCHDLSHYGIDGQPTSKGHLGRRGTRNAPTVYNAAGHFTQFWDGRSASVEDQAKSPILEASEMGMTSPEFVVATLKSIPEYRDAFASAFPDERQPVTFDNVGKAIGSFERRLSTPGRWDRYVRGDTSALTDPEKQGLRVFLDTGCMVCHTGPLVGGSMFQRAGVFEPWPNQKDTGRQSLTKRDSDKMMFKVPSLRNVEKTAPYFHDGSAATLEEAVKMMGKHQLGLDLPDEDIGAIVVWLKCLTGELPAALIARPTLPPERRTARGL